MSELSLARQEIAKRLALKAVVVNGNGDVSIDGTVVRGIDGRKGLEVFFEGVDADVKEVGQGKAEKMYRGFSKRPGRLGKSLQTALNLSRLLDSETVVGR